MRATNWKGYWKRYWNAYGNYNPRNMHHKC
jgi:hypothetical protein